MQLHQSLSFDFPRRQLPQRVWLSSRDYDILEFLLEMKFASLEELFSRFFKRLKEEVEAKNSLWARKRILQLEQAGLIRREHSFSESRKFYLCTMKGYYALSNRYTDREFLKPLPAISLPIFAHDWSVLKSRMHLEECEKATSWISDRWLRADPELAGNLSAMLVPDAIYRSASGEKIAFEVEIARKEKAKYREKIARFVSIMRSTKPNRAFERVRILCAKIEVLEFLKAETKVYGDLFQIQSVEQFFNQKVNQSI